MTDLRPRRPRGEREMTEQEMADKLRTIWYGDDKASRPLSYSLNRADWYRVAAHVLVANRCSEFWDATSRHSFGQPIFYKADQSSLGATKWSVCATDWRSSIHMPRWASRLFITVIGVRGLPLQDISEENARAEAVDECDGLLDEVELCARAKVMGIPATECRVWFAELWDNLHGNGSWDSNPAIVALTFTVHRRNIDAPAALEK